MHHASIYGHLYQARCGRNIKIWLFLDFFEAGKFWILSQLFWQLPLHVIYWLSLKKIWFPIKMIKPFE